MPDIQEITTRRVPRQPQVTDVTRRVPRQPKAKGTPLPADATRLVKRFLPGATPALRPDETASGASSPGGTSGPGGPAPGTLGRGNRPPAPFGTLEPGTILCGDCVVQDTVRPHETTRPGLYDCLGPEGRVMVKVAASEFPPHLELWQQLPQLRHSALLETFRVVEDRGRFCEVQRFYEGGTLDDVIPHGDRRALPWETVERHIVTPFAAAIAYLHGHGIVHRDIKPKNLYLRRSENKKVSLIVGDFDISSVLRSTDTSRDTDRTAGTHFYMAPESFPRIVDTENGELAALVSLAGDFYSFGVVLVELLQGTTSLHSGRFPDVHDFYMSGGRLAMPAGLSPRAVELLQGLLIRKRRNRWGSEELERWLANATTDEDRRRIREDAGFEFTARQHRPCTLFVSRPTDLSALALAMCEEPVVAEEELVKGDLLINWIGEVDMEVARDIRGDREFWRRFPRVLFMHALMRCDPRAAFPVAPGVYAESAAQWCEIVESRVQENPSRIITFVNRSALYAVETWLRLRHEPEVPIADALADLRSAWWPDDKVGQLLTPVDLRSTFEEVLYMMKPARPYLVAAGLFARTPSDISRLSLGAPEDWASGPPPVYLESMERWRSGYMQAWIRQRLRGSDGLLSPVGHQCEAQRTREDIPPEVAFENTLRLLDPQLPAPLLRITDPTLLRRGIAVESGWSTQRVVHYDTVGQGHPFGAWDLEDAPDMVKLDPLLIRQRSGELTVTLDSTHGGSPGTAGIVTLKLAGGNCALHETVEFGYHIRMPESQRRNYVVAGALCGGGLMGGARLAALIMSGPERALGTQVTSAPTTPASPADAGLTEDPRRPGEGYFYAGVTVFLAAFIAFYLWLECLKRYAHRS